MLYAKEILSLAMSSGHNDYSAITSIRSKLAEGRVERVSSILDTMPYTLPFVESLRHASATRHVYAAIFFSRLDALYQVI